jgi:hypothetical protein
MNLILDSGWTIFDASEEDIRAAVPKARYAILERAEMLYIQFHVNEQPPFDCILEYREGSANKHFEATDRRISRERVLRAFCKYLRGESWWTDFRWKQLDPATFEVAHDDDDDSGEDEDEGGEELEADGVDDDDAEE